MSTVIFKKKKVKPVVATKKRRLASLDSDDSDSGDEVIHAKAKRGLQGLDIASAKSKSTTDEIDLTYRGDRTAASNNVNDATRAIADIDGYGEAALLGRSGPSAVGDDEPAIQNSKMYSSIERVAPITSRKVGPVKAPSNVRAISVIDYQPDVCKDYKQTGFCGFGDTCKFLHDRGDFKQGWQLDRDWEDIGKGKKDNRPIGGRRGHNIKPDEDESTIPFACTICKSDYKDPIITKCGHYFCEKCAIQRYKKNPACAQCGVGTSGLFSVAKHLKALLAAKQKRIDESRVDDDPGRIISD